MMKNFYKKAKDESGQALVLYAALFVVLMGFAALVIDLGMAKIAESTAQNAADAAVMAAVESLPDSTAAENAAVVYAQLNGIEASDVIVTTPYNGDAGMIEIVCKKQVNYT
ncbi:MAG: pilus assembly protein TadG-related protein, partial [Eubacteriales bacterium]